MTTEQDNQEVYSVMNWVASELQYRQPKSLLDTSNDYHASPSDVQRLMAGELKRALLLATRNIRNERTVLQMRARILSFCEDQQASKSKINNEYINGYNELTDLKKENAELDTKIKHANNSNKALVEKLYELENKNKIQKRSASSNNIITRIGQLTTNQILSEIKSVDHIISKISSINPDLPFSSSDTVKKSSPQNLGDSEKQLTDMLIELNVNFAKKNQEWFNVRTSKENQKSELVKESCSALEKAHTSHLQTYLEVQSYTTKYKQLYETFLSSFQRLCALVHHKYPTLDHHLVRNQISSIIYNALLLSTPEILSYSDVNKPNLREKMSALQSKLQKLSVSNLVANNGIESKKRLELGLQGLKFLERSFVETPQQIKLLIDKDLIPTSKQLTNVLISRQDTLKKLLDTFSKLSPSIISRSPTFKPSLIEYDANQLGFLDPKFFGNHSQSLIFAVLEDFKQRLLLKLANTQSFDQDFKEIVNSCKNQLTINGRAENVFDSSSSIVVANEYTNYIVNNINEWANKLERRLGRSDKGIQSILSSCSTIADLIELSTTLYSKPLVPWHTRNFTLYKEYLSTLQTM